ncbi:Hypothetical protein AA314_05420 [Archangium gephyra]|uniref:Uncharacterized protein n=1 Tax=Archangium gephyra TaxID=48 RepID=A0AAC8QAK2_9BACT|nr:Hypothetical protein AA314_05420 [Archangium gephyra]
MLSPLSAGGIRGCSTKVDFFAVSLNDSASLCGGVASSPTACDMKSPEDSHFARNFRGARDDNFPDSL